MQSARTPRGPLAPLLGARWRPKQLFSRRPQLLENQCPSFPRSSGCVLGTAKRIARSIVGVVRASSGGTFLGSNLGLWRVYEAGRVAEIRRVLRRTSGSDAPIAATRPTMPQGGHREAAEMVSPGSWGPWWGVSDWGYSRIGRTGRRGTGICGHRSRFRTPVA